MNKTSIADTQPPLPGEFYDLMQEVLGTLVVIREALPLMQHLETVQSIQVGVNQLLETDNARREEMEFLADIREKIVQGLTILHEQLVGVDQKVNMLATPPAKKPDPWWKPWVNRGYAAGAGIALTAGVGLLWPATPYKGFAIEVNGVIKQSYEQLPKGIQEQFKAVYRTHNFVEPGQRGGR